MHKKRTPAKQEKFDVATWATASAPPPEYSVKMLRNEVQRLKRELLGVKTGQSIIVEAVKQAYEDPPDLEIPPPPKLKRGSKHQEIAVLHVSDVQWGKITPSYDSAIAEERLLELARKTEIITNVRRNGSDIRELRIYLGGDIVEGEDIFPTQSHQIDQGVFDQAVKTAPAGLAKMVFSLAGVFEKIRIVCVAGNHGRNGSKGTRSHPKTNWDLVTYNVLKHILNRPNLSDRITVEISEDTFYAVDQVYDWGCLIVHGDQITGGFAGFPWYGTAKRAWGWIDAIEEPWDYLLFGHFHTPASAVLNHRIFYANGTTESDNDYARASLAASGHPCQRLLFFEHEHGVIADHLVWLGTTGLRVPSRQRHRLWRPTGKT